MTSGPLLFRADANVAIGTGHVMRCLALAQAWQDAGGSAVFAMAESTPAIIAKLVAESCEVRTISGGIGSDNDANQTIAMAKEQSAEWVVVDGYQFSSDYQLQLKKAELRVLFLDDYGHSAHYYADLVLNQNAQGRPSMYASREPYTKLLLGAGYALLRREFNPWRGWKREISTTGRKILVTMGGSDPENFTAVAIEALRGLRDVEAIVVVGGSNPHFESIQQSAVQDASWMQVNRGVENMPELMAWADVAISAAGSTCWELCCLGLPSILIDLAENQTPIARELASMGVAIHLGSNRNVSVGVVTCELDRLLASSAARTEMMQREQELVDGLGAARVAKEILQWG